MDFITIKGEKIHLKRTFDSEKKAYEALLTEDLKEIYGGCQSVFGKTDGVIDKYSVFEVTSVRDIGKRAGDDPSAKHCYLIVLNDGMSELQGFEYNTWDFLPSVGDRVLIIPPVKFKRGLLFLSPYNLLQLTGHR